MAVSVRSIFEWFRDHTNILDAGLAHSVYHEREGAEGNGLVAAQVDGIALRIAHLRVNLGAQFMDIYGIVSDIDSLRAIDRDDDAGLGDFLYGFRFGDVDFDSGL